MKVTYDVQRRAHSFAVLRRGIRGGIRLVAVYADEISAAKVCDFLSSQQRYELKG